jgi:hypothetical protein
VRRHRPSCKISVKNGAFEFTAEINDDPGAGFLVREMFREMISEGARPQSVINISKSTTMALAPDGGAAGDAMQPSGRTQLVVGFGVGAVGIGLSLIAIPPPWGFWVGQACLCLGLVFLLAGWWGVRRDAKAVAGTTASSTPTNAKRRRLNEGHWLRIAIVDLLIEADNLAAFGCHPDAVARWTEKIKRAVSADVREFFAECDGLTTADRIASYTGLLRGLLSTLPKPPRSR